MATRKSSSIGGILGFLGALIYLYVIFTWYGSSGTVATGSWLAAATFLTPFVIAIAIFGALSLFFMNIGVIMGKGGTDKDSGMMLWKWITWTGVTALIITGGGQFFWWAVIGVILTMLGGAWDMMM